MKKILILWLPFFVLTTVLCGLIHISVQQDLRQSANDPQIQLAEDVAAELSTNQNSALMSTMPLVDIQNSLAPFVITYDSQGNVVDSTGHLSALSLSNSSNLSNNSGNVTVPHLPQGVFEYVQTHGEDRITWQPQEGLRIAAVITKVQGQNGGFVLAGRSLREVEHREDQLMSEILAAWIVAICFTFACCEYIAYKL